MTKYKTKYRFLLPDYKWSEWVTFNQADKIINWEYVLACEVSEFKCGGNNEVTPRTND